MLISNNVVCKTNIKRIREHTLINVSIMSKRPAARNAQKAGSVLKPKINTIISNTRPSTSIASQSITDCQYKIEFIDDWSESNAEEYEPIEQKAKICRTAGSEPIVEESVEEFMFDCPFCDSKFSEQFGVYQHMRLAHPAAVSPMRTCKYCHGSVKFNVLNTHQNECKKHVKEMPDHAQKRCDVCDARFANNTALTAHLKTHLLTDKVEPEEPEVVEVYDGVDYLEYDAIHDEMSGGKGESPSKIDDVIEIEDDWPCVDVDDTLIIEEEEEEDVEYIEDDPLAALPDYGIKTAENEIKEEVSLDDEQLLFDCPVCDMKFINQGDVYDHLKNSDCNFVNKSFNCNQCSMVFRTRNMLVAHGNKHMS